jgi:hypothetical protein
MRKITTIRGVTLLVPEKGEKHPNAGRPKGAKNVMTRQLKKAMFLAAAQSQHAKDNGGGLVGYFIYLADEHPELFVKLLLRFLPRQREPDKTLESAAHRAADEVRAAPIARGVRKVDMTRGNESSNVIDGPFKKARLRR